LPGEILRESNDPKVKQVSSLKKIYINADKYGVINTSSLFFNWEQGWDELQDAQEGAN
jgi:hypothetical protein